MLIGVVDGNETADGVSLVGADGTAQHGRGGKTKIILDIADADIREKSGHAILTQIIFIKAIVVVLLWKDRWSH